MVLSAFQENQTTGAWLVLTDSSPKTVWFGLRPPGAGFTLDVANVPQERPPPVTAGPR